MIQLVLLRGFMKAAVYYGKNDIRVEDVPDPKSTSDNMIAKVEGCAICGTDLKSYMIGSSKIIPPKIIGHEMVGRLIHVGKNVKGFQKDEYVTLATTVPCGNCHYCQNGLNNLCLGTRPISSYYDGAFAEYIELNSYTITQGNVIKIPEDSDHKKYTLSEPLSCAINAHNIANVKQGSTIVIIGGGPLGAIHAELARAEGVEKVFVVEISKQRLELMKRLSGVELLDSSEGKAVETVKNATHGLGADVVMVCAPAAAAMEQSFSYARKGAYISFFASLPKNLSRITIDSRDIHYNELRVVGASDSRKEHVQQAVELLNSGKINAEAIITHSVKLTDILKGFELMRTRESLKVLVDSQAGPYPALQGRESHLGKNV
jgi:L-iditol 2-dehydrogenase